MSKRKHHKVSEAASQDHEQEKKRFRSEYDANRLGRQCEYELLEKLGGGSFGDLFLGMGPYVNGRDNRELYAIKVEKCDTIAKYSSPQLRHEYKVYRELTDCHGFCNIHYFGQFAEHNIMVMDLLERSLDDAFSSCRHKFSLKTILQIADQLIERVETMHSRHLIHRDIKPANFVLGRVQKRQTNTIFAIDFGLSKRFRDPLTLKHTKMRTGRSLTGTPRYASINNHKGVEQSRRDDLESLAYVLIFFFKGSLPWQGLSAETPEEKYRRIYQKKINTSIETLCEGMPPEFAFFLKYSRGLRFDETPDYDMVKRKFSDLYRSREFDKIPTEKGFWDWD